MLVLYVVFEDKRPAENENRKFLQKCGKLEALQLPCMLSSFWLFQSNFNRILQPDGESKYIDFNEKQFSTVNKVLKRIQYLKGSTAKDHVRFTENHCSRIKRV